MKFLIVILLICIAASVYLRSYSNKIYKNNISHCRAGVYFSNSYNNHVIENNIFDNDIGIDYEDIFQKMLNYIMPNEYWGNKEFDS